MFKLLLLLVLSASSFIVASAERIEIFASEVLVQDQSAEQRALGFDLALRNVLEKVTGKVALSLDEEILREIGESSRLVKSYVYQANPFYDQEKAQAQANVERELAEYLMKVSYSGPLIEQKVQALVLPFWGALRPELLAWVVYEKNSNRRLLSSSDSAYSESVYSAAKTVGLPVFLPVADLDDFSKIDINEVWGLFPNAVVDASLRYKSDLNFVVKVSQVNGVWQGAWAMMLGSSRVSGRVAENTHDAMWLSLMRNLASILSDRYAVLASTKAGAFKVRVSGLNSFGDYVQLRQHLRSLSTVKSAILESIDYDVLNFDMVLLGTPEQFDQQVGFGRKLRRDLSVPKLQLDELPRFEISNPEPELEETKVVVGGELEPSNAVLFQSVDGVGSQTSTPDAVDPLEGSETSEQEPIAVEPLELEVKPTPVAHYIWQNNV